MTKTEKGEEIKVLLLSAEMCLVMITSKQEAGRGYVKPTCRTMFSTIEGDLAKEVLKELSGKSI